MREWISHHKSYVTNSDLSQATGKHYNQPGHNIKYVVAILEKVKKNYTIHRKKRESYLRKQFKTYLQGLNKLPW